MKPYITVIPAAYIDMAKVKAERGEFCRDILQEALENVVTAGQTNSCTYDALVDEVAKMPDWANEEAVSFMREFLKELDRAGATGDIIWT